MAELRIDAGALQAAMVTRVSVDADGIAQDLMFNPNTGTFDATLFLTPGAHSLTGRAFSGPSLVGESAAVTAQITTAAVTRVELRILDLTAEAPSIFGPLFASLTFPTTAQAELPVAFAASVVAPNGDPVTYAWTSDCSDAAFGAPDAATTTWTKQAPGSCTISVVATSNGFSVERHFSIAVFPAGTGLGAAEVSGALVTHPQVALFFSQLGCQSFPNSNASCPATIASPATTSFSANVITWGGGNSGALEYTDNCGGSFGSNEQFPDSAFVFWLPPVAGGLCILTVRATNADGVSGSQRLALLVDPGTAPPLPPPPQVFASMDGCFLNNDGPAPDCGGAVAGGTRTMNGQVFLAGGLPGRITVTDSCVGAVPVQAPFFSSVFATWTVPSKPFGTSCTVTLRATTLQGSATNAVAQYTVQ